MKRFGASKIEQLGDDTMGVPLTRREFLHLSWARFAIMARMVRWPLIIVGVVWLVAKSFQVVESVSLASWSFFGWAIAIFAAACLLVKLVDYVVPKLSARFYETLTPSGKATVKAVADMLTVLAIAAAGAFVWTLIKQGDALEVAILIGVCVLPDGWTATRRKHLARITAADHTSTETV